MRSSEGTISSRPKSARTQQWDLRQRRSGLLWCRAVRHTIRPIAVRLKVEQNQLVGIFAEFVLGVGWLERL
jgi:hypothetical protein